ncbi:MAG: hypothetical protein M9916_04300 [Crocinitomicaceae bacterium]|nr:hypothetical protein [Crocinitomicaceae bacterium]
MKIYYILFAVLFFVVSCGTTPNKTLPTAHEDEQQTSFSDELVFAEFCINKLIQNDLKSLQPFTTEEVTLAIFGNIKKNGVITSSFQQFVSNPNAPIFWGMHPASGDSIKISIATFFKTYISRYNSENHIVEVSTKNEQQVDLQEKFPNSIFVSYYIPPSEKGNLDWDKLIVIVKEENKNYQLQGIVHNQWMP